MRVFIAEKPSVARQSPESLGPLVKVMATFSAGLTW